MTTDLQLELQTDESIKRLRSAFKELSGGKYAFKDLEFLRSTLTASRFSTILEELVSSSWPFVLTQHGFKRSLQSFDEGDIWREFENIRIALEQIGATVFLTSGSLLGLVRDDALILMDDDIDIGVYWPNEDATQIAKRIFELPTSLPGLSFSKWHSENTYHQTFVKKEMPNFDVFPSWVVNDDEVCLYPHGNLHVSSVFPTSSTKREDYEIPLPKEPNKLLALAYGQWRVPNQAFSYDWKSRQQFIMQYHLEYSRLRDRG